MPAMSEIARQRLAEGPGVGDQEMPPMPEGDPVQLATQALTEILDEHGDIPQIKQALAVLGGTAGAEEPTLPTTPPEGVMPPGGLKV